MKTCESKLPLNRRQTAYVRGIAAGKSKRQAAIDAGYAPSTARNAAELIEGPGVRAAFTIVVRWAAKPEKIVRRLAEGLDAMETKFFQHEGEVIETRNVIAWSQRRQYLELAVKYGGYFVERQEIPADEPVDAAGRRARIADLLRRALERAGPKGQSS